MALAAVLMLAAAVLPAADAHGYMMVPMARNWLVAGQRYKTYYSPYNFYQPMNLNRAGKPNNGATCGGTKVGDSSFEVGGKLSTGKIVATYKSGAVIKTTVQITNNHWGFFTFRLCPLTSTSVAAERARLSEACLNTYPLKNASTKQTKLWLYSGKPGASYVVTSSWHLPAGVKCSRCILQWRYITGHSCYLPGVDKAKMLKVQPGGNRNCPVNYAQNSALPSEKFWNCADIKIT